MLTLQIGQCGNQLGTALFDAVAGEYRAAIAETGKKTPYTSYIDRYFFASKHRNSIPNVRSVLIDTEPKVVSRCIAQARSSSTWSYRPKMTVCEQTGAGNNWAFGSRVHGPKLRNRIAEKVRHNVEEMDRCPSFLVLQSVAGGTGSGVGTHVTKYLRDSFGSSSIFNAAVWPYESGEVIVQNYNAVLTLAELTQSSDGIILFENSQLHQMCGRLLNIKRPSFMDLNRAVARHLVSTLLPSQSDRHVTMCGLDGIASTLCCHPGYRLLNMRAIPQVPEKSKVFTSRTWSGLLKHLNQMLIADSVLEEGINWKIQLQSRGLNKSIANILTIRGKGSIEANTNAFRKRELYAPWAYDSLSVRRCKRVFAGHEKSAALLSNSQSIIPPLERSLRKAWEMFNSRAYVHQYARHGVEEGEFAASLLRVEQVLRAYRDLSSDA